MSTTKNQSMGNVIINYKSTGNIIKNQSTGNIKKNQSTGRVIKETLNR